MARILVAMAMANGTSFPSNIHGNSDLRMDEETHPIIESRKVNDVSCLKVTVVALGLGLIVAVSVIIALAVGLGVTASSGKTTGGHSDNPTSSFTPTPTPSTLQSHSLLSSYFVG